MDVELVRSCDVCNKEFTHEIDNFVTRYYEVICPHCGAKNKIRVNHADVLRYMNDKIIRIQKDVSDLMKLINERIDELENDNNKEGL